MGGFSELRRQLVHVAAGSPALLLPWLAWWQAALCAAAAVSFNALVLPRIAPGLVRPGDGGSRWRSGIAIYPLAVLGLILCFPHRFDIVACAWGVLAAGDGMATLVGVNLQTPPLPWNRRKSAGGLLAFVVCGSAAGVGLTLWNAAPGGYAWALWPVAAPIAAAVVAALIETAPIALNDNISVPTAAALTLWSLSFVTDTALAAAWPVAASRLVAAIGFNAAVAAAGWLAGTVTVAGALTGFVIGAVVYASAGPAGWAMLLSAFVAAAVATRLGYRRKAALGIAETRGGRRGPGNAIANTGLAAWAAAVGLGLADARPAHLALVAALVTAASDTVASEVGKAWGRTTWLVVGFRRVRPGTSGAVSLEGTLAGALAAALLAWAGYAAGLIDAVAILIVAAAATAASFIEGALGATLEGPGILDNDALNFINSAIGAGLALAWWTVR